MRCQRSAIFGSLQPQHHFLCNLKLKLEIANPLIAPTLEKSSRVSKKPIQFLKGCSPSDQTMPRRLDDLQEPITTGPEWQEMESSMAIGGHTSIQQEGSVIRA
jgi:hypothetical protein